MIVSAAACLFLILLVPCLSYDDSHLSAKAESPSGDEGGSAAALLRSRCSTGAALLGENVIIKGAGAGRRRARGRPLPPTTYLLC